MYKSYIKKQGELLMDYSYDLNKNNEKNVDGDNWANSVKVAPMVTSRLVHRPRGSAPY